MAQEIEYAAEFGIDFWAFCAYPIGCTDYSPPATDCPKIQCCADNYGLSYALDLYLKAATRDKVPPCAVPLYLPPPTIPLALPKS